MGSSLSDIPGAGGKGRRRGPRRQRGAGPWRPPPRQTVTERSAGRRPTPRFTPRLEIDRVNLLLGAAFAVLLAIGVLWLWRSNGVTLSLAGAEDGGAVTTQAAEDLTLDFVVSPSSRLDGASLELDGEDITDETEQTDRSLRWSPNPADPLQEGEYAFTLRVPRAVAGTASRTFRLGVDDTDPVLEVEPVEAVELGEPVTVTGQVDERVELTAGEEPVPLDGDGEFVVEFEEPPAGTLELTAVDPAGNTTAVEVVVPVRYPSTQAIHLDAVSWSQDAVRAAVLDRMGEGFNAVVLDVKDECGLVAGDVGVETAEQVGAVTSRFDLGEAARAIHDTGGRAIARIVAFRDPALTAWGWSNGHPAWVLQDAAAFPWPDFGAPEGCEDPGRAPPLGGGAANFADPDVQGYVLDLVRVAAEAGFDDVLLDDVRRPSGDLANMDLSAVGPAPPGEAEEDADVEEAPDAEEAAAGEDPVAGVLSDFLGRAREAARSSGAYLGVTVSGLSVRDPLVYSQDLAAFAPAVDYLAPEVYPESYSSGFFNLASPIDAPGRTVAGALGEAREQVGDTPVELVPWLQDYSGTVVYGPDEVQAQVDAAAELGWCSYVREDPERNYTAGITPAC